MEIEKKVPDSEQKKEIIEFVTTSKRGLMKGFVSEEVD
jgi:hypothetical protein